MKMRIVGNFSSLIFPSLPLFATSSPFAVALQVILPSNVIDIGFNAHKLLSMPRQLKCEQSEPEKNGEKIEVISLEINLLRMPI